MPDNGIYSKPINTVDIKARLYRKCEAMVALMAARGISTSSEIISRVSILDLGIEKRLDIPLKELLALETALAVAIRPALPQAVELLHWESTRPKRPYWDFLNFMAPVSAIRKVVGFTILCFIIFFVMVIFGGMSAVQVENGIPIFSEGAAPLSYRTLIPLTLFYTSISAIGACFAALYDANRYIGEGTYDPQLGASYAIRIGLGMMSGIIISQVLFDLTGEGALFGRIVLALLGGFAGELLFNILSKLTNAVRSLFDEDSRNLIARLKRDFEAREQAAVQQQQAAAMAEAAVFAARMQTATNPVERAAATRGFLAQGAGAVHVAATSDLSLAAIEKASYTAAFLRRILAILPSDEGEKLREELDRLEKDIARVRGIENRGELAVEAAKLGARALTKGPLKTILANSLNKFAGSLGPLGISPTGLTLVVVTLAGQASTTAYRRWKARVLDAPYVPDLLPIDPIDAAAVQDALDAVPDAKATLQPTQDDMAALNVLGRAAADLDPDSFFDRYGRGFAGSRESFDAAVAPFRERLQRLRREVLSRLVEADISAPILELSGTNDSASLLAAIDKLQANPETFAELEKLFLLAAGVRESPTAALDLRMLREVLVSANGEASK